jgi:hypothetical protein
MQGDAYQDTLVLRAKMRFRGIDWPFFRKLS